MTDQLDPARPSSATGIVATEAQRQEADELAESAVAEVQRLRGASHRYLPMLYPAFYRAILQQIVDFERPSGRNAE